MPTFTHKRHHRTRTVAESDAEGFRTSPNWREIGEETPDASILHDADPVGLDVPDGTVAQILEWAGVDPARRYAALMVERAGKGRSTLIKALEN